MTASTIRIYAIYSFVKNQKLSAHRCHYYIDDDFVLNLDTNSAMTVVEVQDL